ncbi:ethanolamine-phosphate cytidylyltransferase-like [Zingiber officinale]|uniref:ethanolamine-phosphate cytidylyltransferase-like n=1 Tax=Zingiber officinale TaxID=94328 RepID=UPI001C4D02C4|nr:ethanolamine-phosphate cytidylyltransferase-like [Zingiber officinale]XP_042393412.1 ethanolamine-phosphate cytidylyltransferase-like [Zingiber officinale]
MEFHDCSTDFLVASGFVAAFLLGGLLFAGSLSLLSIRLLPPFSLSRMRRRRKKPVRVYMDGCFDMMHYGHCNALRQARMLGDQLVVGVISDEEIKVNKGPPVTSLRDRMLMVGAVKWVDEVIPDAPYAITEEFMNKLFTKYDIDYVIHGDDPCVLPDGRDAYALAKKAGRYKQIKRTEGVSSTDIVGRMLLCVRERSLGGRHSPSSLQRQFSRGHNQKLDDLGFRTPTRISHFLPTSRRIVQFSNGKGPGPDARIVYIDGAFDLFHAGHVEILRLARELGDFLLVGIHTDETISAIQGAHRPIMNLHERSLSVLACRYVDEVIIGAPWEVSKDMITTFNISLVVHGTIAENMNFRKEETDPYAIPMAMGIYKQLTSPLDITTSTIIRRIVSNHEAYQKRNEMKEASEKSYYDNKTYISGD